MTPRSYYEIQMVSSNKFYEIALEVMLHLKPIASSNLNALEQFLKSYNV